MPRMHSRRDLPLEFETSPFFKLLLLVNLTAKPFASLYARRFQLSLDEWRILLVVARQDAPSATEVADALGLDKMAVSRALRRLVSASRMERRVDPQDGRRATLALTDDGWTLYKAIAPAGGDREEKLLSELDEAEREALDRLLDKLVVGARRLPAR